VVSAEEGGRGVIVACACCGGDGVLVHEIGFDRTTGAVMELVERCVGCDGTGGEWIEGEPLDEDALDGAFPKKGLEEAAELERERR
jgi:hypothetical protein